MEQVAAARRSVQSSSEASAVAPLIVASMAMANTAASSAPSASERGERAAPPSSTHRRASSTHNPSRSPVRRFPPRSLVYPPPAIRHSASGVVPLPPRSTPLQPPTRARREDNPLTICAGHDDRERDGYDHRRCYVGGTAAAMAAHVFRGEVRVVVVVGQDDGMAPRLLHRRRHIRRSRSRIARRRRRSTDRRAGVGIGETVGGAVVEKCRRSRGTSGHGEVAVVVPARAK